MTTVSPSAGGDSCCHALLLRSNPANMEQEKQVMCTEKDMNIADMVKMEFESSILAAYDEWKLDNEVPDHLFTRNRKLDKLTMIKLLCLMGGNSLRKELYDFPGLKVASSSFSERRAAINSELLYLILCRFSDSDMDNGNSAFLCKGRKLIAMDGVNFNTALNKNAPSFMPAPKTAKGGYNQYKATVMLDLLSHQTVDMTLHPISGQNEHADAAYMVAWNDLPPSIVVCDRLYASYPLLADFIERGIDFVMRTKQDVGALKPIQALPMRELDEDIEFTLTDSQSRESKEKGHIYVNTGSKRGKKNSPRTYVSRFSYPLPYVMRLRVVRGKLPTGKLETLLTSLPRDEFSAAEIMELYKLRWREELFFRHIKYDCGASRMKCRKEDYSRQEIYGHFITSAAVWKIINGIALEQNPNNAYEYRIDVKMATYLVKKFLGTPNASGEQLIADMSRYLVQVKPDRANVHNLRPTSFVPFNYRVA